MSYSKDYSSIYHLVTLGNIISEYKNTLREVSKIDFDKKIDRIIFQAISTQAIIFTDSFMDEYDGFFKSSNKELNNKIYNIKKALKPAISKIREWSDIKNYRNNVLCHNLRKNNKSVFINGEIDKYNVPNNVIELQIMAECICLITSIITSFFKSEYNEFLLENPQEILSPDFSDSSISSIDNLDKIYTEVKINLKKLNISYI